MKVGGKEVSISNIEIDARKNEQIQKLMDAIKDIIPFEGEMKSKGLPLAELVFAKNIPKEIIIDRFTTLLLTFVITAKTYKQPLEAVQINLQTMWDSISIEHLNKGKVN